MEQIEKLKRNNKKSRLSLNEANELNKSSVPTIKDLPTEIDSNSNTERLLEYELKYNRIPYSTNKNIIQKIKSKPSFAIPKYKILIFCDSNSQHSNIEDEGWEVLRFSASEIKKSASNCINSVLRSIATKNNQITEHRFTFIDLFSGIGGFRIPMNELGGKCLGYSEINKKSIETYKLNFDNYPIDEEQYLGDITKLGKIKNTTIDIIVGGVPCQAWSVAGKMKGFEDPRGKLWQDAIRVVDLNQPKAFIFENVKGLADPRNKANLDLIVENLESVGYDLVPPKLLNSYDFGVPQNRDRIFVIGFRKDLKIANNFTYPKALKTKPKLFDILENIHHETVAKQKISVEELHGGKLPLSRNRFQKIDELNDFFVFCDTRNGHSTIHSWDIIQTTKKEKEICMTILKNRRKKKYGIKDGNPLSYNDLKDLIGNLKEDELEKLVSKNILKKVDEKYEFQNSKNSAGINGIYRIYLPNSDIFSTLTATGTKDMIALENVKGKNVNEYKSNFINNIYKKKRYRPISSREAGRLQGFPYNFAVHPNETIAKKQFGNAVSIPVIFNLVNEVLKTGIINDTGRSTYNYKENNNARNFKLLQEFS